MVSKFGDPIVNNKREIEVLAHSAKMPKIVISFIAIQSWSVTEGLFTSLFSDM